MNPAHLIRRCALALAIAGAMTGAIADEEPLFTGHAVRDAIVFEPASEAVLSSAVDLIITGPGGFHVRKGFDPGELREIGPGVLNIESLPDGLYNYEIRVVGTGAGRNRADEGSGGPAQSMDELIGGFGTFTVRDGSLVDAGVPEPMMPDRKSDQSLTATDKYGESTRDQVVLDDQIVQGSLCVGFDCVNGENFGFDTFRLKENNLRIKFQDTSSSGSFPTNDWQITANDSNNGGANKFSIEDIDGGRIPFTIEAGTPSNSLYADSSGHIGMGTSTPVVEIHMADGDTPTMRLEQDGSSGFTAQTWDVAGNEANFFVRDVTNGSKLPFKIKPGAPTDSLFIAADGDIGMGTASPGAGLHLKGSTGNSGILIEETQSAPVNILLNMLQAGNPGFELTNTDSSSSWQFRLGGSGASEQFLISKAGTGSPEMSVLSNGDVNIRGTLTTGGPACSSGCDRVFTESYTLQSVAAHSRAMWEKGHLPAVGPTSPGTPFNVTDKLGDMLHELEKAHIFIDLLAQDNAAKQESLSELRNRNRQLEARLDRLEEIVQVMAVRSGGPAETLVRED
ncbi:MAG: hypothetical protein ACNS61_00260 [Candidatus Wenzhouxiangella sp. M2_3B_020]